MRTYEVTVRVQCDECGHEEMCGRTGFREGETPKLPEALPRGWFEDGGKMRCPAHLAETVARLKARIELLENARTMPMPPGPPACIAELGLTNKTEAILKKAGLRYIDALTAKRPRDLMGLYNFGRRSLQEVEAALKERGLSLAGQS